MAPAPVRLVLGNHDFYGGSMAAVRFEVGGLAAASGGRLQPLEGRAPQELDDGVWLAGAGGWGDGRAGGRARPDLEIIVLCGHTHGGGFLRVAPNLSVVTAPARYGAPRLTRFAADAPAEEIARAAGALLPP